MNQMNPAFVMPDVQSTPDTRQIPIQRVGVKAVRYPLTVRTQAASCSRASACGISTCICPPSRRARTCRALSRCSTSIARRSIRPLSARCLLSMLAKLEAHAGRIEVSFPYFVMKTAPVSGVQSLMDYEVTLTGEIARRRDAHVAEGARAGDEPVPVLEEDFAVRRAQPALARDDLPPNSPATMPIEDLIRIAEEEASCELWGLLKRPDEKFVTERAYENPKFVEDLVRDVATRLNADERVVAYVLEAENFESIHNHSAYAVIERDKRV